MFLLPLCRLEITQTSRELEGRQFQRQNPWCINMKQVNPMYVITTNCFWADFPVRFRESTWTGFNSHAGAPASTSVCQKMLRIVSEISFSQNDYAISSVSVCFNIHLWRRRQRESFTERLMGSDTAPRPSAEAFSTVWLRGWTKAQHLFNSFMLSLFWPKQMWCFSINI